MKFCFFLCLLLINSCWATESVAPMSFPTAGYFKSISILVAFVLIMFFFLKLVSRGRITGNFGSRYLEIVDKYPLEPQVTLYIIKIRDKKWLISIGNKNATVIDDVSDLVGDEGDIAAATNLSFKDVLEKVTGKKSNNEKAL